MLSFIGLPPFAGFFIKYLILYEFFISNHKIISILFLFFSLISSFYYFKVIKILYFTKKKNVSSKIYNIVFLNDVKYYFNYKTNLVLLNLLIFLNLILNFGFPFFFLKIFKKIIWFLTNFFAI